MRCLVLNVDDIADLFVVYYVENADLHKFFSLRFFKKLAHLGFKILAKGSIVSILGFFLMIHYNSHQILIFFTKKIRNLFVSIVKVDLR